MNDPTILLSRDELALGMMREYSQLCAQAAHVPSRENFLAADAKREAILRHAQQQEHAISVAIERLTEAAEVVGGTMDEGDREELRRCEATLRALIGIS